MRRKVVHSQVELVGPSLDVRHSPRLVAHVALYTRRVGVWTKERDVGPYGEMAGKPGVDGLKLKAVRISARQDAAADIRENDWRAPRPPPERCLGDLTL
eukprot:scaffold78286_cov63-Phaeocystis_antarctica.AAC.2